MPAAEGDFAQFARSRWVTLVRMAYPMTLDAQRAEDLAQEALVKLWFAWPRVREENPDGYVRRILVRLAITSQRRLWRRERPAESVPDRWSGIDEVARSDDRVVLLHMLAELSPRQRAVVVLRFMQDLSELETAELLGCSPGSVKQHTSRALAKLRATSSDHDGAPVPATTDGKGQA